jgi:diguanylate cyclase (GGDEF)-like protein
MGKKIRLGINILILSTIIGGFIGVFITSSFTYNHVIRDDIKNISRLTATNIYSDISNELTKPIFVSLTMANDSFLKSWLQDEETFTDSSEHEQRLINYLNGIKEKYNYDSVFFVSAKTDVYYHFNGVNKIISSQNEHDKWYYDFINSNKSYELDIDTDEANENRLSIFINCRVEDENGELLGVTGVGLELNQVQELLETFSTDFDLDAMLFDKDGKVLIHSTHNLLQHSNVFEGEALKDSKEEILNNQYKLGVYEYKEGQSSGYIITRYIDDLDWYLLVKKDTGILVDTFRKQLLSELLIIIAVIACVLLIVSKLMKQNDSKLMHLAKIDVLTSLLNRRGFNESLEKILQDENYSKPLYVFVLDIDCFKNINDSYGHLIGDKVIRLVGRLLQDTVKEHGILARWGGDEFTGYLVGEEEEVKRVVEDMFQCIRTNSQLKEYKVTISMGLTALQKIDTADTILFRADKALYEAKEKGRDQYIVS